MKKKYKVVVTKGTVLYLHPLMGDADANILATSPRRSALWTARTGVMLSVAGIPFGDIPTEHRSCDTNEPVWLHVRKELTLDDFETVEEM